MQTVHWTALILGLVGVALVIIGVLQQRSAAPGDEIVAGFGGPAGSSDVGTADGFETPDPHAHFTVGRTARLIGLALIIAALVVVVYSWLA